MGSSRLHVFSLLVCCELLLRLYSRLPRSTASTTSLASMTGSMMHTAEATMPHTMATITQKLSGRRGGRMGWQG